MLFGSTLVCKNVWQLPFTMLSFVNAIKLSRALVELDNQLLYKETKQNNQIGILSNFSIEKSELLNG